MIELNKIPKKQRRTIVATLSYTFFVGMMFWYGIEQLFIEEISADHIKVKSYTVIAYSLTYAFFNVATGSFSDRYGRKLSLVIAAALQAVTVLLLGLASTAWVYTLLAGLYAVPTAFSSGADRALIYDSLKDAKKESEYAKITGFSASIFLLGAATANIFGGFIAERNGLDFVYFLSVIPCLIALASTYFIDEPEHHKTREHSILKKISISVAEIKENKKLGLLTVMLISTLAIGGMSVEFGQAQFLEVSGSAQLMGLFWFFAAIVMSFFSYMGGRTVGIAGRVSFSLIVIIASMIIVGSWAGLALIILIMSLVEAVLVYNDVYVNNEVSSSIRNTVSSTLRTLANIALAPLFYLGGVLSDHMSVRIMISAITLSLAVISFISFSRYLSLRSVAR